MNIVNNTLQNILSTGLSRNKNSLSVYDAKNSYSYEELELASIRISNLYLELGCVKGDRVAVIVQKSPNILPFILACWKIGCIFTPLDTAAPDDRLEYQLNDIQPTVVVGMHSESKYEDLITGLGKCSYINFQDLYDKDNHLSLNDVSSEPSENITVSPGDPAYCIYTSGSTGNPKGVLISHASCISFFDSVQDLMQVDNKSRCLSLGPLIFDVTVIDLFFPLYMGVPVYLYSTIILPILFGKIVQDEEISHFCAPSPILTLLAKDKEFTSTYDFSSVKVIMTGADILDSSAISNMLDINENLKIINGYGPTEATCVCTAFVIDSKYKNNNQMFPIGKALNGVETILVDKNMNIVNSKEPGEILVSGKQLLLRYWNNELETKSKLVNIDKKNYYKTGDIAKYDNQGNMIFLGRADEEVKISGIRIHLNEIRYALMKLRGINEVVVTTSDVDGKKTIIAAVEKSILCELTVNSILDQLKDSLPKYMVPKFVKMFDKFPTLPSGKLNKKYIINEMVC